MNDTQQEVDELFQLWSAKVASVHPGLPDLNLAVVCSCLLLFIKCLTHVSSSSKYSNHYRSTFNVSRILYRVAPLSGRHYHVFTVCNVM